MPSTTRNRAKLEIAEAGPVDILVPRGRNPGLERKSLPRGSGAKDEGDEVPGAAAVFDHATAWKPSAQTAVHIAMTSPASV